MGRLRRLAALLIALTLLTQFVPARVVSCAAQHAPGAARHHRGCCHGGDHACCHMSKAGSSGYVLSAGAKPCPCQFSSGKALHIKPNVTTAAVQVAIVPARTSVETGKATPANEPGTHATDSGPPPGGEHMPDLGRAPPCV